MAPSSSRAQLVLGLAQTFGASLGIILLVTSGVTPATVGVTLGTSALTVLSRLLARGRPLSGVERERRTAGVPCGAEATTWGWSRRGGAGPSAIGRRARVGDIYGAWMKRGRGDPVKGQ